MLYKNLPFGQLFFIMCIRVVLDYVAAVTFLLKGHIPNAKAVVKARLDFWRMRSYRKKARRKVWKHACNRPIPEQRPFSILWSHYVRRVKAFASL